MFVINFMVILQHTFRKTFMARTEIILPAMGEGITDATITKIFKKTGDKIAEDEIIFEIATDKVDSEITAPHDGFIAKIFPKENDTVQIGDIIAIITTTKETLDDNSLNISKIKIEPNTKQTQEIKSTNKQTDTKHEYNKDIFLSPLVKSIIKKENIHEPEKIKGTGLNGRITKNDVLRFINKNKSATNNSHKNDSNKQHPALNNEIEIIPMNRIRKLIAEHMVKSKHTSPHVTSFIEVDMTNIVLWRNTIKEDFKNQTGEKLTFTPIFIEAAVKAVKEYPMINTSVEGENIIKKKFINIGLATALPNGNLIVPVIKKACQQSLIGLAKSVNDMSDRARKNNLTPDEITGGTFTITNFGIFDNIAGTPIINQPEVAILGIGAIKKRPVVIETKQGDTIGIKHMSILSLSYDHRVIDGALGGMFLKQIAENLENFDTGRKF